ncbi:MAG: biotin/acetyl-CoA-carboxylase ligase [Segetibacter sp.]|nr:biotin/acetyl-CoA-carboxylase ligase [Segetibacter sp.]
MKSQIGQPFFELGEVDSSNNYAMRMAQAHLAVHGTTWFAHYQTAGKGQRGKAWKAEPGQNIMMSCLLEPDTLSVDNQFVLNAAIALACFKFFNKYAIDKTSIKWPNDIFWGDRKAGGILIENVLHGEKWRYAIVGIGLNINQTLFPEGIRNPVSLKQITGNTFDVIALAKELCFLINNCWNQLLTAPFQNIFNEYSTCLYRINEMSTFRKENLTFNATVRGINEKGELLVETPDQKTLTIGSIEWVLP